MDLGILIWIQHNLVFQQFNDFFIFITNLWGTGPLGALIAVILIIKKETRLMGIIILVSLTLNFIIVNLTLKPLLARPQMFSQASPLVFYVLSFKILFYKITTKPWMSKFLDS